jgi:UDP-N-acetylglucosamine--N-acetylmuramyl-(pentapeptide) pyrophosphoryl-undecaprenol N-acetylglucosamine transferase
MRKPRPIILVGGGTGGHIIPLLAVAEELAEQKVPFIYVGQKGGREETMVRELGYEFYGIQAGKWRRYLTPSSIVANVIDTGRVVVGFLQALIILLRTKSPTVFSKGDYVAIPMIAAAACLRRRLIAHESDTILGLASRVALPLAEVLVTAFPADAFVTPVPSLRPLGIPIRRSLRQAARLPVPRKTRPLILVIGGIQGSRFLNTLIGRTITKLIARADVVHVTGDADSAAYLALRDSLTSAQQKQYQPFAFLDRKLAYYLRSADLVVSRASATVLAEAALFERAVIAVPLPNSANGHQLRNAQYLADRGAVESRQESTLTTARFLELIDQLLDNSKRRLELGEKLRQIFYKPSSVADIVHILTNEKN